MAAVLRASRSISVPISINFEVVLTTATDAATAAYRYRARRSSTRRARASSHIGRCCRKVSEVADERITVHAERRSIYDIYHDSAFSIHTVR